MSRLPENPSPVRYDLALTVDPKQDRFSGELKIELRVTAETHTIELHAADLDFENVAVEVASESIPITQQAKSPKHERMIFQLARALKPGPACISIQYNGPLRTDLRGLYGAKSGRHRYAVTQLEAADARRFFPCFDEPDKKARFRIRVTTPKNNAAVSNGAVEKTQYHGRLKTVQFEETPPLSTYLIALVVGEMEHSRTQLAGKTPIRVWHVPGKKRLTAFALEAAAESLKRLEAYFGLPYPYSKLDLIAVPDFEFGAMENAGAVTFRESLLLVDPKTITLDELKRVAEVIAHELAHMWYGDLVTMAWWDDLWLNEAFATWMAFHVVDQWKPEWKMWLDFEQHRAAAYSLDSLRNTHPIYTQVRTPDEATENFDVITYEKGASVVRMLERWLGANAFRKGVRQYIRRHRESNARAQDLWDALSDASGKPVATVARDWIEKPGFPLVQVKREDDGPRVCFEFTQERFFANPLEPEAERREQWPIPLVVRIRRKGRDRIIRELMRSTRIRLRADADDEVKWIYGNAEESGFYRPVHSEEILKALGDEFSRLEAAERMGVLGHQWSGFRANRASLTSFLTLVEGVNRETEPDVLEAAAGPLAWLSEHVVASFPKDVAELYRDWVADVFLPAFLELGWSIKSSESPMTKRRRAVLLRLCAGIAEDAELIDTAELRVDRWLVQRKGLDASLAGPAVEIAARYGGKRRYTAYRRMIRNARSPQERSRFEFALAAFRDPALIDTTLESTLKDEVATQNVVFLLGRLLGNPSAREATWAFIRSRWSELSKRISPGLAPRLVSALPALQLPRHRDEVASFFERYPLPTAARALKQALERFDLDEELRQRAKPHLRGWLRKVEPTE